MSGLDIEAIRARFAKVEAIAKEESPSDYRLVAVHAHSAMDVPVLLAQLERERDDVEKALGVVLEQAVEIEKLRAELNDRAGQLMAARTASDLYREERDEARADLAYLRNELDEEKAAGTSLRAELTDARFGLTGERDDALQVISDLRGEAT